MSDMNALRGAALWSWFVALCPQHGLGEALGELEPVSGDASFRRYFRGRTPQGSWILVDAPPEREDSRPFLQVQARLAAAGVRVPGVVAADLQQGFMCLEDFGGQLLWPALDAAQQAGDKAAAGRLYGQACAELLKLQLSPAAGLPAYDAALLRREVLLFRDWLCAGILGLQLGAADTALLDAVFDELIQAALAQPQVCVHRDYHSRNLMLLDSGLGVIDFQDAVQGPFSYDLVSLLKDCYIAWPASQVEQWALQYLQQAQTAGLVPAYEPARFLRDFHLMGAQRHLKAAGIFCRLWLRDGKPGYLQDIPRTLGYIAALPAQQGLLGDFGDWLQQRVLPGLEQRLQQALQAPQVAQQGSGA
jgi:aminoglycoside/choline kinase family phosphotransferase